MQTDTTASFKVYHGIVPSNNFPKFPYLQLQLEEAGKVITTGIRLGILGIK